MNRIFLFLGITGALLCFTNSIANAQANISKCASELDSILHKVVYLNADKLPEPNEKFSAFQAVIIKQVKLSEDYAEHTGRVIVAFVVESDGKIDGIRVVRDKTNTNYFISNQIVKAIENYKLKWKPGSCNGKPVPVLFTIPFHINIQE